MTHNPAVAKAKTYSITDLSREYDVTTRAIRFYEDQGLLQPTRRGRTRVYTNRDRVRLKLILRGKRLGFSLQESRELFDLYDSSSGGIGQMQHFLKKIRERRAILQQQQQDIENLLHELDTIEEQCESQLEQITATAET